jgi:transcriptional regulator with XRE-family HTH domain
MNMNSDPRRPGQFLEVYSIGPKLRALRSRKGLTLSRLAMETGLSPALLSKLETDRMIPTLPTLANICRVYGVGIGFFFAEPGKHSMSITRWLQETRSSRKQGTTKQFLLNARENNPILAREVDLPPKFTEALTEAGKVFSGVIYVLRLQCGTNAPGE